MRRLIDRRTFLQSTGIVALASVLHEYEAWAAPTTLAARSAANVAIPTAAQKFNGGRSQVGVNALQWGGAYPFINLLKTAQTWSLNDGSGCPTPDTLDTDGYPVKITNGGVYTVFYAPSQSARPGNYVITWSGNGTISLGMSNTKVSGSLTSAGGSGRYVFATTDTRFVLRITAVGNPHITNVQVFHVNDEAALNAGEVFGVKFKQRLQEANFGVIRFLAWQGGNTTNETTWATRKPLTYFSYASSELRPSVYAGVTTNSGPDFTAVLPGFRLADKATVIVKFNVSIDAQCTLNVSGTGPIRILDEYSNPLSSFSNSFIAGGTWRSLACLVYDSTLNAWIKQGGDIAKGYSGISNGCPPELMVRLCAEVGAHPHFVTPPLAIDPATDYMPNLAAYCRSNGPAWMIPRFEGPNELWNVAANFYCTWYAKNKAAAYGWGADYNNWYGKVMSVLGQIASNAYNGDRSKYQVLCGVQTGLGLTPAGTSSCNARLESTKYVAQTTTSQAPFTKTPAKNWVTHVVCAQYITPSEYNTALEKTHADAFAAASGNATKQAEIASLYAATVASGSGTFTVGSVAKMYANWKTWALSYGIKKMCGYEGGYSPDYGGSTTLNALRAASKLAPVLSEITTQNYKNFVGLTDSNFVAEFPSSFVLSGASPSASAWAILEDVYQSPNPPQWTAIVNFNRNP